MPSSNSNRLHLRPQHKHNAVVIAVGVHGYQTDPSATQQQQNRADTMQNRAVQGTGVDCQHAPSATPNSTSLQQQKDIVLVSSPAEDFSSFWPLF